MVCINHCKMLGLWHWVYVSQPHLLENHSELSPQLFTEGLKYPALTLASFRAFSWPIVEVVFAWVSTKTPSEMSTKTVIQWGYTLDLHGMVNTLRQSKMVCLKIPHLSMMLPVNLSFVGQFLACHLWHPKVCSFSAIATSGMHPAVILW